MTLHAPLRPEQIHAMPVEFPDLAVAAARYAATLREIAGSPPVQATLGEVADEIERRLLRLFLRDASGASPGIR